MLRRTETCTRPINVQVRAEYSETVGDLTRRFFHYLVRHQQLVKGFQLAVDVDEYDLFMDIHHAAVRRNVPDLAHAALIKVITLKATSSKMWQCGHFNFSHFIFKEEFN